MINIKNTIKNTVYLVYLVIVTLIGSEIVVRSAPNWIPKDLIGYLSPNGILEVYKGRGKVQDSNSPIYHFRPFQKMNWYPHIKIDENGFRNSIFNQSEVDTVLLGDSLIYGKDSKVDLGDMFREKGVSALNLGIGGYAPQHYRDVYKKYVIDKNIKHKSVIVIIFVGNDFHESIKYPWDISLPTAKGKTYYPWIVNLIIGALDIYKNTEVKESKHKVSLPYKEIGINYLWWTPVPSRGMWNETEKALNDILKLADLSNAKVSFVIVPSPASVYGTKLHPDFHVDVTRHNNIVNEFKTKYKNVNIIDPTKQLAKEIEKKFLYTEESDCHFNTYGTKVFFDILIRESRNKKNI